MYFQQCQNTSYKDHERDPSVKLPHSFGNNIQLGHGTVAMIEKHKTKDVGKSALRAQAAAAAWSVMPRYIGIKTTRQIRMFRYVKIS